MTSTIAARRTLPDRPGTRERFRPTRAGVINVWDYVDEEFAFADGRLALRGHNGSGKTKALEVLFPFMLDGVADSRRLDPFSGENRTMKSNLLYRGQEAEYGYVWIEFARPGEIVTLIIGLRAHRSRDGVVTSFFITGKRLGIEFGLLSADSRPLTERQLRDALEPGAWHKSATEYRDAIDARLFGLGRERYAQLLDLLLALRRPLLAKDLDPGKVSDTLTSGLSPVDDELVQQAARDFENLAAVQKQFDDLTSAHVAVREFLAHYTAYLKAHAGNQLDRVQVRSDAVAGHAERIAVAAAENRRAAGAEQQAESARDRFEAEAEMLAGRLAGLRESEEYKAQGRLEDKRREVVTSQRYVTEQRSGLAGDGQHIDLLRKEADKLSRRFAEARSAEAGYAADLADAGLRSGIAEDGSGPADTGDDLIVTAKARVLARQEDVREIRRHFEAVRIAEESRAHAEADLGRRQSAEEEQAGRLQQATDKLARVRGAAAAELADWSARWSAWPDGAARGAVGPAGALLDTADAGVLAAALECVGEAGAPGLTEVFAELTAGRREATITAVANLQSAADVIRQQLETLRAERDVIASEHDDAPRSTDLRTAQRDGPGAPLWELIRFADTVDEIMAAAVEGALFGAGLLTAWIHPDPEMTAAALEASEPDGYLIGGADQGRRTLADVLVPEDQEKVPAKVITAVLRSIRLSDDLAVESFATGQDPADGAQWPVVTTRAQFSYGVHLGARPKLAPEYIGATYRANRRRARLAERDAVIASVASDERQFAEELMRGQSRLAEFGTAQRQLPDVTPVATAAQEVSNQATLLAAARADLGAARRAVDSAIAAADGKNRLLRQAGAARNMPTIIDRVEAIETAIGDFADMASKLAVERAKLIQTAEDLAERTDTIERLTGLHSERAEALAVRERTHAALAEELETLEATISAGARKVLAQIGQTESLLAKAKSEREEKEELRSAEHDKASRADQDLRNGRDSLTGAISELHEQVRAFGPYARPNLIPLIGVVSEASWPPDGWWPAPEAVASELASLLMKQAAAPDVPDGPGNGDGGPVRSGEMFARSAALPASVAELLDAFHRATRGRAVTEGTLKNTAERMSVALKEFTESLAVCDEDYRVEWDPAGVVTVHVLDADGRHPVAAFAARIAGRAEDQGILLAERERAVLEDELLTGLAQQIHSRVLTARDLVRAMNADTRSKPMSSGLAVGIRWAQSDRISDRQRSASRLLDRDAAALGPERLAKLRGLMREMIKEYRAGHPRATYREALAAVLDYRSWHAFELLLVKPGEPEVKLTRAKHSVMSGGEKSASIHLPLFAAANALYSSAKPRCPRLIALDEAFVGIDERYKPDLFGLTVKFDLDLFMTGHDLWVTCETVPAITHYDMYHDEITHTVSSLLMLWDGEQLLDTGSGYSGNDELVTVLVGFRPTRHAPFDSGGATLYADLSDDEDDLAADEGGEDHSSAPADAIHRADSPGDPR
jgi:hypothetical protein